MIQITLSERIFLKDPLETDLGKRILHHSVLLIDEIGFEAFTFKKLSAEIGSTEASVYRYFVNKHQLLSYLIGWYWSWMLYQLQFQTNNIACPRERFNIALRLLADPVVQDDTVAHINEESLHRIVVQESSKAYLRKEVDADNKEGYYAGYKRMVAAVASILKEINPDYEYAETLVSTVVEGAHHQQFFANHLPSLTNITEKGKSIFDFFSDMVNKTIG